MTFEERGLNIVNSTKSILATNLMKAMSAHGTAGAVEFCSVHAITLTDSIAEVHDAKIRRVTDRPRNPANQAISIFESIIKNNRSKYVAEAYFGLAMGQLRKENTVQANEWLTKYVKLEKARKKEQANEIIHKLKE